MTPNEIIAMAREADPFGEDGRLFAMASVAPGTLERFAALVADSVLEDAARYRGLKSQASEKLLNPRAALSEICADMRTHWKLPTLICSGPVGGYPDFDAAIDAAREQGGA